MTNTQTTTFRESGVMNTEQPGDRVVVTIPVVMNDLDSPDYLNFLREMAVDDLTKTAQTRGCQLAGDLTWTFSEGLMLETGIDWSAGTIQFKSAVIPADE